jgi:hypothetical protein
MLKDPEIDYIFNFKFLRIFVYKTKIGWRGRTQASRMMNATPKPERGGRESNAPRGHSNTPLYYLAQRAVNSNIENHLCQINVRRFKNYLNIFLI